MFSEQRLHVLLVIGAARLRTQLVLYLQDTCNYEVAPASDNEEALALLDSGSDRYAVALIDIRPSSGSGGRELKLLAEITRRMPGLPCVALTGRGAAARLEALRLGARQALPKPFELEELAIVIEHVTERRRHRLEKLARATSEIMANLGLVSLNDRLTLIAQHASEILEAESSGIFLVKRSDCMTLEASFGHREGGFSKGREFVIHSEPGSGLTGHIAYMGVLFSAHGANLTNHPARRGEQPHTPSGCYSLLAIPLKHRHGDREELVGLLRVDNKRNLAGRATPDVGFTRDDEWIVRLFAHVAVVAIEDAKLVAALREQTDYLDRLIASLPNGVIAIDRDRRVTQFNRQAQAILKYEPEEILGHLVDQLYDNPQEPHYIGQQLHEADGRLADYETVIRSKTGERIPIRLAATWLFNAQHHRIGSVGYFEDLRAAQETQRRLDVLLKASNIVAQAEQLNVGLKRLAEMMVTLLRSTFCRIFLLDDSGQYLIVTAVYPSAGDHDQLDWTPGIETRTAIADWPSLDLFLAQGVPRILRITGRGSRDILAKWSERLKLRSELQSLLVIPLRTHNRVVGLLDLGEIRPWEQAPFTEEMLQLASAIGDQTAVLIDRMRLYEAADQQRRRLAELDAATRQLRAEKDPPRLHQTIVRLAVGLVGGTAGGLFLNHPHIEDIELAVAYGFSEASIARHQSHTEGLIGHVARTGSPEIANHYACWQDHDSILVPYHFESLIGVPLRHAGEVEAVLFVAHNTNTYQFSHVTLDILQRFAIQASLVLHTSSLMNREQRAVDHLAILHQMSVYIQATKSLDDILQVTLTVITAGYGLGFNRASMFLLDERREYLVGQMGIGHIYESEAERAWAQHAQIGMEDFHYFCQLLERGRLTLTPVGERIRQMRLPVGSVRSDIFSQVVQLRAQRIVYPDELTALPARFIEDIQPTTQQLVVPLIARTQVIGVLVVDNKFTREPITRAQIESLLAFANTAAIAIDNHNLLHETNITRQKLQSFFEASNTLVSSQDPERVLREIVERARVAADAQGVSMVLIDEREQVRGVITSGSDTPIDIAKIIRPQGISIQVLRTGRPAAIENAVAQPDRVNSTMYARGIAAGLCLPMSLQGRRVGVMWFHYPTTRTFLEREIAAVQLYVNQAAIAYDTACRLEELSKAHDAARVVAEVTVLEKLQTTLQSIVVGTQDVLDCHVVSLYVYYQDRDRLQHPPFTIGVRYPERANRAEETQLLGDPFVLNMLRLEHMEIVEDTHSDARFQNRRFTRDEQIASCVVIPLKFGLKRVGVMFVNYRQPHRFTKAELTNIELFANQAAIAIRNAQLYDREQQRAEAFEALYGAGRAVTGSLKLDEIVQQIFQQALRLTGDRGKQIRFASIRLVERGQATLAAAYMHQEQHDVRTIAREPINLHDPDGRIGVIGRAIKTAEPQLVKDVTKDLDYLKVDVRTHSELAVPIKLGSKVIGVINVEHPEYDTFDEEDQRALELLAAQAAVAIENARLFAITQGLHQVALAASSALQLDTVLRATAEAIAQAFVYESVGIHLLDETTGQLTGSTYYAGLWPRELNTRADRGITGRVVRTGVPALVPDVALDPDYIPGASDTRAELCVPLRADDRVVGVINVESTQLNAFSDHDLQLLETIARQVVSRIENAQLYTQLEQTKVTLAAQTAVAWMGMVGATWRHAIEGHALTIAAEVKVLQQTALKARLPNGAAERLAKIERMAKMIQERPITPATAAEEVAVSVQINDLLRERLRQLQQNDPYRAAEFLFHSTMDDSMTVRISRAWIRGVVDILIDNAIEAMRQSEVKRITVATLQVREQVEISIADTGCGIPVDVQPWLLRGKVPKAQGDRGMGMGLLLAQTIVQTYGGEIEIGSTDTTGTTMLVRLPIERSRKVGQ